MRSRLNGLPPTRVLFADDDGAVRKAVARTLRRHGMIVDLAVDGTEALSLAREFPYAVVATDYRMPGLSGLQLVRALRLIRPDASYVIVTGAHDALEELASATGVYSVVPKPWTDDGLVTVIEAGMRDAARRRTRRAGISDSFMAVGGQFVLLLEDNDLDALLLDESIGLVAPKEFRIVRARTLAEARKHLQRRAYSAILADLGLPDASGLATLAGLLAVSPDTPVLVITGSDDESLGRRAVSGGAQDYLLKGTYDPEVVLRAIHYAVERKRIELRLSDLAHYDALTGLANRALMCERQKHALARAARSAHHVALLAIDLDHFKVVNDTHGHDMGDALLVEVARRLSASTRSEDTVARIGGDEFVVLLEDLETADGARRVGQRIRNAFATPIVIDGKELQTTPSVGIALFPDDAANLGELQRHADVALYEAKHAGGNAYQFFSRELQDRAEERLELERNLVGALAAGAFHVEYLPVVDVQSGATCGYEALLRWSRGKGELLPAHSFLKALDESGEIILVGEWVLAQVCADAAVLPRGSGIRLSINISARELANPGFVAIVEEALRSSGVDGGRLEIELPEIALSTHLADARSKLPRLAALGVTTAVDGYGAACSSILELAELPISTLKLDHAFIAEINPGRRRESLSAILAVARSLGWCVVAKCVETREQLELLHSLGCPRAQGRFLSSTVRSSDLAGAGQKGHSSV
jgi:diguanylate cyclase (GGDEF)-like protein